MLADTDEPAFGGVVAWLDESASHENLLVALALAAMDPPDPARLLAILHLGDDKASAHHANYRPAWNRTLHLFNLLQFLPGAWWITRQGVRADRYPEFALADKLQDSATQPDSDDWAEATKLAAEPLQPAMRQWTTANLPAPEVGCELTDDKGQVHAEAELIWPMRRVAILRDEQAEETAAFEEAGWRTYPADDDIAERVINDFAAQARPR